MANFDTIFSEATLHTQMNNFRDGRPGNAIGKINSKVMNDFNDDH